MKSWNLVQTAPLAVPPPLQGGKLISYFLFTRHGARAPLFNWSNYPVDQLKWIYGDTYTNKSNRRRIPIVNGTKYDFLKVPNQGRLLEIGVKQHENLGKLYHDYLTIRNKLLPSTNFDHSKIYIRSSVIPRAIESAASFLHGMYKPQNFTEKLCIETGKYGSDPLYPSSDTDNFYVEKTKQFIKTSKFQYRLSLIPKEIMSSIPKNPVSQMLAGDFIYCLLSTNLKLPKIIDDDNKRYQMMIHSNEKCFGSLYSLLNSNLTFGTTGFIEFLGKKAFKPVVEIFANHLKKFLNNETDVRFTLFSGHDITISSFLIALGIVNKEGIPPYASHFAAELWEKKNKRVIRFVINGDVIRINNSDSIDVDEFLIKYVE